MLITDGPVHSNTIFSVCTKIDVTKSVTLASPHQRTSAYLITAHPVHTRIFVIWLVTIIYKAVFCCFRTRLGGPHLLFLALLLLTSELSAIFKIPGIFIHRWVGLNVLYPAGPFKDQGF